MIFDDFHLDDYDDFEVSFGTLPKKRKSSKSSKFMIFYDFDDFQILMIFRF